MPSADDLQCLYEEALDQLATAHALLAAIIRQRCPHFSLLHLGETDAELVASALSEYGTDDLLTEIWAPAHTIPLDLDATMPWRKP